MEKKDVSADMDILIIGETSSTRRTVGAPPQPLDLLRRELPGNGFQKHTLPIGENWRSQDQVIESSLLL